MGLYRSRRDLLVVHGLSAPRGLALLPFPCVELRETAVIVMAQALEVVEGYHLQVGPGENLRQLLADGFEDAYPRQLLYAFGKSFLFTLRLLLRGRLVAGHAVVNFAFFGLANVEESFKGI